MRTFFIAFAVSILSVFFKALQNRQYNHNNYAMIVPTSLAIGGCELYLLSLFVHEISIRIWIAVGTGSGLGGMVAMYVHERWIKR